MKWHEKDNNVKIPGEGTALADDLLLVPFTLRTVVHTVAHLQTNISILCIEAFLYLCYSFLLIWGGSAVRNLLHWALEACYDTALWPIKVTHVSSCTSNYLWTSDLYCPVCNAFDAGKSITWARGRGVLGPGNLNFWTPNGTPLRAHCHFTGPKPFPLALVMDLPAELSNIYRNWATMSIVLSKKFGWIIEFELYREQSQGTKAKMDRNERTERKYWAEWGLWGKRSPDFCWCSCSHPRIHSSNSGCHESTVYTEK